MIAKLYLAANAVGGSDFFGLGHLQFVAQLDNGTLNEIEVQSPFLPGLPWIVFNEEGGVPRRHDDEDNTPGYTDSSLYKRVEIAIRPKNSRSYMGDH